MVRNSERIGFELDMAVTYATVDAHRKQIRESR